MEFRLLGSVEVWAAGQPFDAGQPRQRNVLAALLVDAGRLVTWETLIDRVWGHQPPDRARHSLYSHVARIRRVLADAALVADAKPARLRRQVGGYLMDVDPDHVDLHRFQRLADLARAPGCPPPERLVALREALALWRGEPLAGLAGDWADQVRSVYGQQRLDAVLAWADAERDAGNSAAVIVPLTQLTGEYPLVEALTAALMRALHAAGRTAHALDCYRATRQRLVDEMGTEPGRDLQRLHLAILRGDPGLAAPVAAGPTTPARDVPVRQRPAQLPADIAVFAGRGPELARLDAVLAQAGERPAALVIATVTGTAGVGKTTLALHWAHRVAGRFPDGQLYVNLRGFDPGGPATQPGEALRGFLEALAVPRKQLPADLDAQAALYRSRLAGRRVLVLLDNARDAGQVDPLLPGGAGNLVVVTSRSALGSLVTTKGAHQLTLDLPSAAEARALVAGRVGPARVAAEPAAVDEIIARCARLPLALAIAAARAATRPDSPLDTLAGELRRSADGLEAFAGGEAAIDVRTVFSWSYRTLSPGAARMFRLLSRHPGPDLPVPAAAGLAAVTVRETRRHLAELAGAHLVAEYAPGRYTVHDLLRSYAAELAAEHDSAAERQAADVRMLDHYLHTAHAADRLLHPRRDPVPLPPAAPGSQPVTLADAADAQEWFAAERAVLLGAVRLAAGSGLHRHAWQLAWAVSTYLDRYGHWHDWAATQQLGLDAARHLGDRAGQAHAHRGLAGADVWLGRYDDAERGLQEALRLFGALGDPAGQANVHLDLCWIFERQGRQRETLDHASRALTLYRECGHEAGEARALNTLGWAQALLGDHRGALLHCEQALALHARTGDRAGEAHTLDSLGYVHHGLSDPARAAGRYAAAIEVFRDLGERYYEADTLVRLGDVHLASGAPDAARRAWERAHEMLRQLDHPDAGHVHAKLAAVLPRSG